MDDILAVVLTANPAFTFAPMTDGAIVLNNLTGDCFELNRTGASILASLKSGRTGREVLALLTAEYAAPPTQMEVDLRALLADFLARGMLISPVAAQRERA
jgi:hypothetical protein